MSAVSCPACGAAFADDLAYCAHRPWKNQYTRDKCKWPKYLYSSGAAGWTLRPDIVDAVRLAEEGPAADFKIRPATKVAPKGQSRLARELSQNASSNGAGSRGPSSTITTDRGTLQ